MAAAGLLLSAISRGASGSRRCATRIVHLGPGPRQARGPQMLTPGARGPSRRRSNRGPGEVANHWLVQRADRGQEPLRASAEAPPIHHVGGGHVGAGATCRRRWRWSGSRSRSEGLQPGQDCVPGAPGDACRARDEIRRDEIRTAGERRERGRSRQTRRGVAREDVQRGPSPRTSTRQPAVTGSLGSKSASSARSSIRASAPRTRPR